MNLFRSGTLAWLTLCAWSGGANAQPTTYTWNHSTTSWAATGAWMPVGPDWTLSARLDDSLSVFGPRATITFQPTIGTDTLFTNGVTFDNTGGAGWSLSGTTGVLNIGAGGFTVNGAANSSVTATIAGVTSVTKSGSGTLILDSPGSNIVGSITVTGGTLQVGTTANNTASQMLRANAVDLASGTILKTVGTASNFDLQVGSLTGSGSVTPGSNGAINIHALTNATFSGAMTTAGSGGLNLRGSNGTTQTFSGNLTALSNTYAINSGVTMSLTGTGDSVSGVAGATSISTRGGTFVMDNTAGNTSAAAGRLSNTATLSAAGGTFSLIGNSAGSAETLGSVTFNDGALTVNVTNNGGTGAQLSFTDTGSLRDSSKMTVNFIGSGTGTLGVAGNNPRITFTSLFTGTNTGLLASATGSDTAIGWATVNGTEWAGFGANGIVAVAPTLTASTNTTLQTATANSVTLFNPSANQTLTGSVTTATLKIAPSNSALSLEIGSNNLNAIALMLSGTNDFTINRASGTGTVMSGSSTRYVYVSDANAVLTLNKTPFANSQPVTKSGAGTLFLSGSTNLLPFTSNQAVNVVQGTLRGTMAAFGGGSSTGGANTTIFLRGGVIEISGGGTFNRAFNLNGTSSGGGINWDGGGSTTRGDGGFSAIGGNTTVTLMTTVGGSIAAPLVWSAAGFLNDGYALTMGSTKADSIINFANDIALDNGSGTNSYFAREIRVIDNPSSTTDKAVLSGLITGSQNADLLKTGAGILELVHLTSNNYAGNTLVQGGTLIIGNGSTLDSGGNANVIVGAGATFAGTGGDVNTGIVSVNGSMIIVQPGGAIRGGNPTVTSETLQTLLTTTGVVINSNATINGILRVEAGHTATPALATNLKADSSLLYLTNPSKTFNFKTGGNKFTIDVVSNATNPLQIGTAYKIGLVHVEQPGAIQLNGVSQIAGANIPASNFDLQSTSFGFSNASLDIDGTGNYLVLSFTPTPVPEPATVLAIGVAALGLGSFARRRLSNG